MEKTSFHFFCQLLLEDIRARFEADADGDMEKRLCLKLSDTIKESQNFVGCDAPLPDDELFADIQNFNKKKSPEILVTVYEQL